MLATEAGLAGLWFADQRNAPAAEAGPSDEVPLLAIAARQLQDWFAGRREHFDLPLDLSAGTAFQQRVWRALLDIGPGQSVGYGALAARIGQPGAARAVGAAVGRNPLAIVVPCHRVLGRDGQLTGYAGGLGRKAALLAREGWRVDGLRALPPQAGDGP